MGSRSNQVKAAVGIAVGVVIAWAALQSFIGKAGWRLELWVVAVVVIGCVVLATAVALSRLPEAMVRRTAYMWGSSILVRGILTFAFAGVPAIIWAIAVIVLFGTRPH